jgi:hypothetical protein
MLYPIVVLVFVAAFLVYDMRKPSDLHVTKITYEQLPPRIVKKAPTQASNVPDVIPVVVLSKPVHSGISIGVNHTKSSDVSDVIDVEVVASYKKVRATTSSKPAQGLTAAKLIIAAKHAAQFPAGYFSQVVNYKDLPQLLTRGRHNESQQPLANFARVFRLPSDEDRLAVVNDQFWRDELLRSFANATDAELLSVYSNWADVSETSGCFGYKPILACVLALRNEANS